MKKQLYTLFAAAFAALSVCAQSTARGQFLLTNNSTSTQPVLALQTTYGMNAVAWSNDANQLTVTDDRSAETGFGAKENFAGASEKETPDAPPCTAPINQPTSLAFGSATSTSQPASFSAAVGGATGYLVVRSVGALLTGPVNGTTYAAGDALGNGIVVQSSNALSFTATNLVGNTRYTYTIFSYNAGACSPGPAYNTVLPLQATSVTCPATPASLSTPVITPSTFQLTWASSKGGGANPVSYTLEVTLKSNFTQPVTGSPFTITDTTSTQPFMSFTVQGLVPDLTYYYRLKANGCNTGTTTGSVITACNPVGLPYTQSFNSSNLPDCWTTAIVAVQTDTKISLVTQGSNPATSPPATGSHFIQYNSYSATNGGAGSEERLISAPLNTTGIASVDVQFLWRNENNTNFSTGRYLNEGMQVQYSTDYGATWIDAGAFILRHDPSLAAGTAQWKQKLVTLPAGAANKPAVLVAFKFHSEEGDNMFLDEVTIQATPGCYTPTIQPVTNLAYNGARINWALPAQPPLTYEVYYSTSNTAPTSSTVATASGITNAYYDATGLAASTTYYAWVRSNCGSTGKSVWSASASFTTLCSPAALPYIVNFDAAIPPAVPNCTAVEDANGDGYTWTTVDAPAGYTGKTLQYTYNPLSAANDWFFTSGANLIGGTSYTLRFKYGNNSSLFTEKMKVFYGTGQSSAAMTTPLQDYTNITGGTVNNAAIPFTPALTGTYYFGFNVYSAALQYNLYLDDISVNATAAGQLPVTLVNFSGQRQGSSNLLRWTIAEEKDVRDYEVQRSENNVDWTITGTVNSLGNTSAQRQYTFSDNNPVGSKQYYRLRMVDLNGTSKLSNTILIRTSAPSVLTINSLFPNPTSGALNLLVEAPHRDNVTLFVVDAVGRTLQVKKTVVDAGANSFALDVSTLAQGTYLLKLTCDNGCEPVLTKFIKE